MVQRRRRNRGSGGFWDRLGAGLQGGVEAYLPAYQFQQRQKQWQTEQDRQTRRDAMHDADVQATRIRETYGSEEEAADAARAIHRLHPEVDYEGIQNVVQSGVRSDPRRVSAMYAAAGERAPYLPPSYWESQAPLFGLTPQDLQTAGQAKVLGDAAVNLARPLEPITVDPQYAGTGEALMSPLQVPAFQRRDVPESPFQQTFGGPIAEQLQGLQTGGKGAFEAQLSEEARIKRYLEARADRSKAETALSINEDQFTRVMKLEIARAEEMAPVEREIDWQKKQNELEQELTHRRATWQEFLDQQRDLAVIQVTVTDEPQFRTYMDPDTGEPTTYSLTRDWSPENYGNLRWTDITEQMEGKVEWSPYLFDKIINGEDGFFSFLTEANQGGASTNPDTPEGRANLERTAEAQNLNPEQMESFFDAARLAHEEFRADGQSSTEQMVDQVWGTVDGTRPKILDERFIGDDPDAYEPEYTVSYSDATGNILFENPDWNAQADPDQIQTSRYLTSDQVQARDLHQIETNRDQINHEIAVINEQIGNIKAQQGLPSGVRNAQIALRQEQLGVMNKLAQDNVARRASFDAYWGNKPQLPPRTSDIHLSPPDSIPGLIRGGPLESRQLDGPMFLGAPPPPGAFERPLDVPRERTMRPPVVATTTDTGTVSRRANEYDAFAQRAMHQRGLDTNVVGPLVNSLIFRESSGKHLERSGKVKRGEAEEVGLMQVGEGATEDVERILGRQLDPSKLEDNVAIGVTYLGLQLNNDLVLQQGGWRAALAAYNAGPAGIMGIWPASTKKYVNDIESSLEPEQIRELDRLYGGRSQ